MTLQAKPFKPKVCKVCRCNFIPRRNLLAARVCSPLCAMTYARSETGKAAKVAAVKDKRETKVKLEKLKSRGEWTREAQAAFNFFIRTRDQLAGHRCISSGKPLDWNGNAVDAGHYRSRGSAPHLRFDERNVHAQSKHDNRYASGNVVGYRAGLIARMGLEAVEALEADQTPRKHSIDDLREIKAEYVAKTKALKATA